MAVAFDSGTGSNTGSGSTSHSFAHTNNAGNYLVSWLFAENALTSLTCTYNAVSMTSVGTADSSGTAPFVYAFGIASPATGSNNVSFSWSSPTETSTAGAISVTGYGSIGTVDASGAAAGTSNVSATVTLGANDMIVAACAYLGGTANIAVVTGTQRFEDGSGSGAGSRALNGATNTGTGSISTTWSRANSAKAAWVGVPVLAPASGNNFLMGSEF